MKKKKRTYNIRLLRARRSYTMREIANLYDLHIGTIQTWHKAGLSPIAPDDRPLLFMGSDIRDFLAIRQNRRKHKLKENEFYCTRCRNPRLSIPKDIRIIETNSRIGIDNTSVYIKGICSQCGCRLTRFSTRNRIKSSIFGRMVTQADRRLDSYSPTRVNTDLKEGGNQVGEHKK